MEVYRVRPGSGVGPVEIGMSRNDAKRAMETTGHSVESFARWSNAPPVLAMQENSFQVYFDRSDRVEEIELMGLSSDAQSLGEEAPYVALYGDVDVFRTPATELAEVVTRDAQPNTEAEDHGIAFSFPTIGMVLWREDTEDTPFFETVLVHRRQQSCEPPLGGRAAPAGSEHEARPNYPRPSRTPYGPRGRGPERFLAVGYGRARETNIPC